MHDDPEIIQRILKPIGKKVSFQYPSNEGHKAGILKDRVIIPSNPGTNAVPYWDVVDLIEFPEYKETDWIRIGYYRKPFKRLVWGSQTTITEPISVWKRILIKAAEEKPWFRKLLIEVAKEIK